MPLFICLLKSSLIIKNPGGQPESLPTGAGTGDWLSGLPGFQLPSIQASPIKWRRIKVTPVEPQFPLLSMKWEEYYFFLLVLHCWT